MQNYIDGFAFPISRDHLEQYQQVADAVAKIYCEHGALEYREFLGDDMHREGTKSFPDSMMATAEETIVFGWIVYESRQSRDHVNQKVETDKRIADLVTPLLDPSNLVFDPSRMAYGGFLPFVHSSRS